MPIFEVLAFESPTKKDAEDGVLEKLIFGPKVVVAKSEQTAILSAVMSETDAMKGADQGRLNVSVHPF